jgi:hypothetical protein
VRSNSHNVWRARQWLEKQPDEELRLETPAYICRTFRLWYADAERLHHEEMLKRRLITLADLTPPQRRALVDEQSLDVHALAAGPIMMPGELYLPAGKISLAEAQAREAAAVEEVRNG